MNYLRSAAARTQAAAMLKELEKHRPGAQDDLATSALATLQTWQELTVRLVPDDQTGGACSVAGTYLAGPPPELAVARSSSLPRRDFTALHELGHHLQQNSLELMEPFANEPDGGLLLEDAACDAFAAEILLPASLVEANLPATGPTASDIVDLWRAAGASRMAVCVKASQHLPAPGHILLLDLNGRLTFAASSGLPPLRRGSDQADIPVIRSALAGRGRAEGHTRLKYRDGLLGAELYAQTAPMGGHLLAVTVTDLAPWKAFAPTPPDTGPQGAEYTCERCLEDFTSFDRACPRCQSAPCPHCKRCGCAPQVVERQCTNCFVVHPAAMYTGDNSRCDECG
ncbi:hypothetical protein HY68_36220 [Streptomyces sp. AcH 505]|uniref:ImmA/IrrE family metallo-endopeptidase n=1 Tax=Streptomyces sp. AcH 505 TaxID=352211 RepID=UPI000591F13D|nr:hypothetical protein HY68_36220 [Streptomyces sp. AcH 505]